MGSAGSVAASEENENIPVQRKSVRQQFTREFGKSISVEDAKVEKKEHLSDKDGGLSTQDGDSGNGSPHGSRGTPTDGSTRASVKLNAAVFQAKTLFMRPIMKNRPAKDKLVIKKQDNHGLLKEMFQRMDPTLNTAASTRTILGEIELAAKFKPEDSLLLIKVGRAKGLSKEDYGSPDPYVAVDMFSMQNQSDLITKKTKVKRGTCNPYFQEILAFPMSQVQISLAKLRVTVWNKVNPSLDDFLGEVMLELCKLDLTAGSIIWYKLHPKTDITFCGNVEICVLFKEPKSLVVQINRANNVKICNKEDQSSNPYARVYITGLPNKFQTGVHNNTVNPVWMESFEFDVYPSEFSRRVIVINLMSKDNAGGRDQHLGSVHISMAEYDYQKSNTSIEYPLADLRNVPYSKSAWSEQGITMEFSEAMKAHLFYGYPKFIFQKHPKGKKMISCRSAKAKTQVKMIIQNGISTGDDVEK